MKIALIGYGKMGQMIEKAALKRGHVIVARLTSTPWDFAALQEADICMEFSQPESILENLIKAANMKKSVIIGTTGWNEKKDAVHSIVNQHQIGVLYSPNFSIGVHLLLDIVAHAAQLINAFEEYGVAGVEQHHKEKKDTPSGTSLEIAKTVEKYIERIDQVPFASIRCGSIPGTHTLLFDSPCDTISITHEARNREGFARGAVQAAEWLQGKIGVYTFAECMREIIQSRST